MLGKKELKGWKETALYCFLGFLIAVFLNRGLGVALGTPLPVVTVSSTSMVPNLNVGDISIVYGRGEYELGDIILFEGWEAEPIIHRIVGVVEVQAGKINVKKTQSLSLSEEDLKEYGEKYLKNEGKIYITKGDGNTKCDQCYGYKPVEKSQIFGKSIFVIPWLGWVKLFVMNYILFNPLGLVGVGFLALIYLLVKSG